MAKQLTDEELNLRRLARRRLIGAIALTLIVVVILPMLLDSEPKTSVQDIELRIPAADKAGEFAPDVEIVKAVVPVSAPVASVASVAQVPGKLAAEPQLEANIQENTAGSESFVAQVGVYANSETARSEAARLKKMGFKAYAEKIGVKFRVRVGPYAEQEKADKARQLLEKHGLHPVVISIK